MGAKRFLTFLDAALLSLAAARPTELIPHYFLGSLAILPQTLKNQALQAWQDAFQERGGHGRLGINGRVLGGVAAAAAGVENEQSRKAAVFGFMARRLGMRLVIGRHGAPHQSALPREPANPQPHSPSCEGVEPEALSSSHSMG